MNLSEQFKDQISAVFDSAVKDTTEFVKDLNATSFHYMFMIGTIEELTGKTVSYSEMKACKTVQDACNLCEKLAGES